MSDQTMRTKRRYAHELYPHAAEDEIRDLATEVPYLYARALGLGIHGTGWFDRDGDGLRRSGDRTLIMIAAGQRALIADALLQGLSGQEAWQWAEERCGADTLDEWIWERAVHYGADPKLIKPYPCGPEPDHHYHEGREIRPGWVVQDRADCKESECPQCCEPSPAADPSQPSGE